jgi:hypothetical protein
MTGAFLARSTDAGNGIGGRPSGAPALVGDALAAVPPP